MAVDLIRAMTLAADLDTILRAGIPSRYEDPAGYEMGYAQLTRTIANIDPKGRLQSDWQGASLRACGIRATCTYGIQGVVGNWIAAVERHAGQPLGRDPATNIGE